MLFLVLEYLKDGDLGKWLTTQGVPTIPVGLHMIRDAALGLDHAHQQGLVHRDVRAGKPFAGSRRARQDFGFWSGRTVGRSVAGTAPSDKNGDGHGNTGPYMAPEQGRDAESVDRRADVYSLGVVLFRLLTGRLPFAQTPDLETMWRQPIPSLADACPEATASLDALFTRMVAKRRDDRFAAIRSDVVVALDECLQESDPGIAAAPFSSTFLLPPNPEVMVTAIPVEDDMLSSDITHQCTMRGQLISSLPTFVIPMRPLITVVRAEIGCPKFVAIPAGTFLLGSPQTEVGRSSSEGPRCVRISRMFWMSVTTVTQEELFGLMGRNQSRFGPTGGCANRIQGLTTERFPSKWLPGSMFSS